MATIRRMTPGDLLSLNLTNLDPLTENYDLHFYLNYLMKWPSLFNVVEDRDGQIVGYIMGKLETQPQAMRHSEHYTPWHGHITVLTVAPAWRRMGHARRLTESLERASDKNNAWFVDLDDPTGLSEEGEDAFDMRKPLSRDVHLKHSRPNGENFLVSPEDVT
ncbi:hypothetical protein TRV_00888 [Trichophyton verrucosum HKI 0517]|uniref:N-acetyltransferase domain-containing protein n=1 Tax=Trichophyton verrucosum (strain HKI 0517) TaxID=663202 RepID=D4D1D8_TRIVH|nr:uncharacterized protein TRV_00888 [Trichophyton verrucosum HKI 0517]EFE44356.1 hypothetical protein TRV_00888 [Trichophyton verrucosum HKI 0517]